MRAMFSAQIRRPKQQSQHLQPLKQPEPQRLKKFQLTKLARFTKIQAELLNVRLLQLLHRLLILMPLILSKKIQRLVTR